MDLEVLVATMQQADLSLVERMNLYQNAVIANQCGQWSYAESQSESYRIRMLSSNTKGVGINRNLALQLAEADILLFADDDVTYYDGTLQGVIDAFRELPDADVIFFGIDMTRNGEIFDRRRNRVKRLHIWNALRYGAARMAVRRDAVKKKRLSFSTLFGGGCRYCSGEDTLFIVDAIRSGLRVYSHSYVLGSCAKDSSSWFSGYNEKYFYDWGALLACAFPKMKWLVKWHFALKLSKKSNVPLKKVVKQMNLGIRGFRSLKVYGAEEPVKEATL